MAVPIVVKSRQDVKASDVTFLSKVGDFLSAVLLQIIEVSLTHAGPWRNNFFRPWLVSRCKIFRNWQTWSLEGLYIHHRRLWAFSKLFRRFNIVSYCCFEALRCTLRSQANNPASYIARWKRKAQGRDKNVDIWSCAVHWSGPFALQTAKLEGLQFSDASNGIPSLVSSAVAIMDNGKTNLYRNCDDRKVDSAFHSAAFDLIIDFRLRYKHCSVAFQPGLKVIY